MESIKSKKDVGTPEWLLIEGSCVDDETLATLLRNLQGLGEEAVVGTGLARFSAQRLAAIRHAAERKEENHLQDIGALLQLMALASRQCGDRLPAHMISNVAVHLHRQTQELACWRELAGQAAYIHEHPDFARRLAQQYVKQAEVAGEGLNV